MDGLGRTGISSILNSPGSLENHSEQKRSQFIKKIFSLRSCCLLRSKIKGSRLALKSTGMLEAQLYWILARNTKPAGQTESIQVDMVIYLLKTSKNSYLNEIMHTR